MAKPTVLYRTTITVWSQNTIDIYDMQDAAYMAQQGEIFYEIHDCEEVNDSAQLPETEYFNN